MQLQQQQQQPHHRPTSMGYLLCLGQRVDVHHVAAKRVGGLWWALNTVHLGKPPGHVCGGVPAPAGCATLAPRQQLQHVSPHAPLFLLRGVGNDVELDECVAGTPLIPPLLQTPSHPLASAHMVSGMMLNLMASPKNQQPAAGRVEAEDSGPPGG